MRVVCSGAGGITDIPWLLLLRRPVISQDSLLVNLPLRCQRCGDTAPLVGVKLNTQGYQRP